MFAVPPRELTCDSLCSVERGKRPGWAQTPPPPVPVLPWQQRPSPGHACIPGEANWPPSRAVAKAQRPRVFLTLVCLPHIRELWNGWGGIFKFGQSHPLSRRDTFQVVPAWLWMFPGMENPFLCLTGRNFIPTARFHLLFNHSSLPVPHRREFFPGENSELDKDLKQGSRVTQPVTAAATSAR